MVIETSVTPLMSLLPKPRSEIGNFGVLHPPPLWEKTLIR